MATYREFFEGRLDRLEEHLKTMVGEPPKEESQ